MRKVIFATMFLMLLSSVGYGADWKYFATQGDGSTLFYDTQNTQSVSRGQHTVIVRTKEVLSDNGKAIYIKDYPDITDIKKISYILDRWEINCSKNIRRQLSSFWYSSEGYDVFSVYYSHSEFKQVVPDSFEVKLAEIVCQEEVFGND